MLLEAERSESAFVDSPSEQTERAWHEAQQIAKNMVLTKAKNKKVLSSTDFLRKEKIQP